MDTVTLELIETKDYLVGEKLGSGGFSEVYRAIHKPTKIEVAIKVIQKNKMPKEIFQRELRILSMLDHPFCCSLYESFEDDHFWYIVMEKMQGNTLLNEINKTYGLTENKSRHVFCQLICALDYLHKELHIAHRDIKAENIMFDRKGNIRLIDFGLGNQYVSEGDFLKTACGSPAYAPPEMLTGKPYNDEADVWSSGIVLYAMLTGRLPFQDGNIQNLMKKIVYSDPIYPPTMSDDARNLLKRLLEKDPAQRITITEITESQWFKRNEECQQMNYTFGLEQGWRDPPGTGRFKINQNIVEEMQKRGIPTNDLVKDLDSNISSSVVTSYKILKREAITEAMDNYIEKQRIEQNVRKTISSIPKPAMLTKRHLTIITPYARPNRLASVNRRRSASNAEVGIVDPGLQQLRAEFIAKVQGQSNETGQYVKPNIQPRRRYSGM